MTTKEQSHGFRLRFKGAIDYKFPSQAARNRAEREIKKSLKKAGLTAADFNIELKPAGYIRRGRKLRLILG